MENINKQKGFVNVLLVVIILILVGGGVYFVIQKNKGEGINTPSIPVPDIQGTITESVTSPLGGGASQYEVEGEKENLIAFSIQPGQQVSGKISAIGTLKGGYFNEGEAGVYILDSNKQKTSHGLFGNGSVGFLSATSDWMTTGPVNFSTELDFSSIPTGDYYLYIYKLYGENENESIRVPIYIPIQVI